MAHTPERVVRSPQRAVKSCVAHPVAAIRGFPAPRPKVMSMIDAVRSNLETMEAGVQPLDDVMTALGLTNHDLVAAASPAHLTHKMVAKGRRGRQLTMRTQDKIVQALNAATKRDRPFSREDCFNYRGR